MFIPNEGMVMKKIIISLLVLLQNNSYSHDIHLSTCTRISCLKVDELEIGFVEKHDREFDEYYLDLNTNSSLTDVLHHEIEPCYTGLTSEVEEIVEALAGNENFYYTTGGHSKIEDLRFKVDLYDALYVKYKYKSDYVRNIQEEMTVIKRCRD
jgi:hypothetical protein